MKVYFVGAGPGDPELLTVKALRLLQGCNICIYAGSLVSPAVLEHISPTAEKHDSATLSHPEVIALFKDAEKRGLDVVRLHTGDPSIYGAIGEQILDLEKLGIAYEVVPGVSAFQASAAALGWELTVPEVAQSIVLTRTPGRTPMPEAEALENFAKTGATLCVFLSAHAIAAHAPLLAKYYGDDCPAAVVFHASWPDQKIVQGTLSDIGEKIRVEGIEKTALFIVRRASTGAQSRLYAPEFAHGYREAKYTDSKGNQVELSEETKNVIAAMDEATWKATEGYRATGLPVPIYDREQKKVIYLSVDEALRRRSDYEMRMALKKTGESMSHD